MAALPVSTVLVDGAPAGAGGGGGGGGGAGLLPFHQEMVDELLDRDGLTVLAEGLGLTSVLAGLLLMHALPDAPRAAAATAAFGALLAGGSKAATASGGGGGDGGGGGGGDGGVGGGRGGVGGGGGTSGHQAMQQTATTISDEGTVLVLGLNDAQKQELRVHFAELAPNAAFPPEITAVELGQILLAMSPNAL
jgi:hypothetical protein